jgi:PKD repeat protein
MSRSDGTINSWKWNFGDGGTSTDQNPTHEYTSAGCYNVSLEVTNTAGAKANETKIWYITAYDLYAYGKQITPIGPDKPDEEFDSTGYDKIKADDDDRKESVTDADTKYAAHRFNFSIGVSASEISKINVTWNGIGKHGSAGATDGAKLRIYNFTSSAYELLQASANVETEVALTGEKTSSISSYISANNMTILVNQTSAQTSIFAKSHIETDYVKLVVTP